MLPSVIGGPGGCFGIIRLLIHLYDRFAISIFSLANGALGEQFWQDTEERHAWRFGSQAGSLLLNDQPIIVLRILVIGFSSD